MGAGRPPRADTSRLRPALVAGVAALTIALGGCGDSSTNTVSTGTPASAPARTMTPTTARVPLTAMDDGELEMDKAFLISYCRKVLGARTGHSPRPTARDRGLERSAITTLSFQVGRDTSAKLRDGRTVRALTEDGVRILANGRCDPAGARTLDDAAVGAAP